MVGSLRGGNRGGIPGEGEAEGGALAGIAFGPDFAAMGLDDVLHDGEAETGAALFAGSRGIHAVEAFEDAVQGFAGDAGSVVGDPEFGAGGTGIGLGANGDAAAGAAVLDGVVDEVEKDLLKAVEVHAEGKVFRDDIDELDLAVSGAGREVFEDAGDEGMEFAGLTVHDDLAGFELGDGEEILDEEGEAVGVFFDGLEEAEGDFGIVSGAVDEGFDVAFDEGEGGAEFVGDIGDELAAGAFEFLEAGDVVEDEDDEAMARVAVAGGGGVDLEDAGMGAVEFEFVAEGLAFEAGALGEFLEFMAAEGLDEGAAAHVVGKGEDLLEGTVDPLDTGVGAEDEESLDHAIEGGGLAGAVAFEFVAEMALEFAGAGGVAIGLEPGAVPAPSPPGMAGDEGGGQGEGDRGPHGGLGGAGRAGISPRRSGTRRRGRCRGGGRRGRAFRGGGACGYRRCGCR